MISKLATIFQEKQITDQYSQTLRHRSLKFNIRKLNPGWYKTDKTLGPSGFYLTTITEQWI